MELSFHSRKPARIWMMPVLAQTRP